MATKQKARKQAATLEVFDLAVTKQQRRFHEIVNNSETVGFDDPDAAMELCEKYQNAADLAEFISSGTDSPVRVGDSQLFFRDESNKNYYDNNFYVLRTDGLIYADVGDWADVTKDNVKGYNLKTPTAVVIPTEKRVRHNKSSKGMVLLNGDEDHNEAATGLDGWYFPTVSFECVNHFFDLKNTRAVSCLTQLGRLFADGTLTVVDYDPDVRRPLSKSEREQLTKYNRSPKKNKPPRPPEAGYTLLVDIWHRSATVVIRDTRRGGKTMLIGQDEGTYFGVELPGHPSSVKEAFEMLTPPDARNKVQVKRQGEWFFVPVSENEVPTLDNCIATTEDMIALSLDTPTSNKHWVMSSDIRVGKDGIVYAINPTMRHSAQDHRDVSADGWTKFLRNTALRSFSVQGVD